jgi:hypothetical protein
MALVDITVLGDVLKAENVRRLSVEKDASTVDREE